MEIYKLSDDVPVGKKGKKFYFSEDKECDKNKNGESELKITDIKQAVKNENRVNVFVNGKYEFSLDITQLLDFKLKVGKVVEKEDLEKYRRESEYGKLYQRALEWVLSRPHSVKETRDYLRKKVFESGLDAVLMDRVMERLLDKKYLNDAKYAAYYVENRFVKKGVSRRRLEMELLKKGIDKTIIEDVFNATTRNEEDEILKMIAKKRAKYDDEKLISYLCRQGFSFELARSLVQSYEKD